MFIVLFLFVLVDFELWGVGLKSVTRPSSCGIINFRALCLHGTAPCIAGISEVASGRGSSSQLPMCSFFLGVKMIGR